jgi:hypothetical protein
MTEYQQFHVRRLLIRYKPEIVHHGDCVGADEQFDAIAKSLGIERVAHPAADVGNLAANCETEYFHEPLPPLERNQNIVDDTEFIIAAPKQLKNVIRSGTWYTVRYAIKESRKKVEIVFKHERAGVVCWEPGYAIIR